MRPGSTIGALIVVTLVAAPLAAQMSPYPTLPPGSRVRVHSAQGPVIGAIRSVSDSAIVVAPASARAVTIPWSSVNRLEISRGRSTNAWRGLGIGALGGAVTGVILGLAAGEDCGRSNSFVCFDRGSLALAGGVGFGVIGGVIGLVAGAFRTHENWHMITAPGRVLRITVAPRGAGLGVSVSF